MIFKYLLFPLILNIGKAQNMLVSLQSWHQISVFVFCPLSLPLSLPVCLPFKDMEDSFSGRIQDMDVFDSWQSCFVTLGCFGLFIVVPFLVFVKLKSTLWISSFPASFAYRIGPTLQGLASTDLSRFVCGYHPMLWS